MSGLVHRIVAGVVLVLLIAFLAFFAAGMVATDAPFGVWIWFSLISVCLVYAVVMVGFKI
jgi:hypothetical protein